MRHRRHLEESMKFIESTLTSAVVLLLAFTPAVSIAKSATAETPAQIFKQVSPSVVVVHVSDDTGKSIALGSGVVIERGVVITNCHVAEAGQKLEVSLLKTAYTASVRYADPDRDLCELSVPKLLAPPITFGDSQNLEVGQRVYAVGAPEGLELSLSEGLVSSVRSSAGLHFIQTTASISPGSSGGGLFDDQGRLVGITTFYVTEGQNLNFALPADWIQGLPQRAMQQAHANQRKDRERTDWVMKAMTFLKNEDGGGLLRLARQWVAAEPDAAEPWSYLGFAYGAVGQYKNSLEPLYHSIRLNPQNAWTWRSLGYSYGGLHEYDKSLEALQKAIQLDPNSSMTWGVLATTYAGLDEHGKELEAYRQALRLDPKSPLIWQRVGVCYLVLEQYGKAAEALQEAASLDRGDETTWRFLGIAYFRLRQFDKTIEAERMALQLDPKDGLAWGKLGASYGLLKEYDKAEDALQEAVLLDPRNSEAWGFLFSVYCDMGERDKAIDVYPQLRKLDPAQAKQLFDFCIAP
jgi:tetratricopeptide (TPR) repeat protein